jgi:hypothetical protein
MTEESNRQIMTVHGFINTSNKITPLSCNLSFFFVLNLVRKLFIYIIIGKTNWKIYKLLDSEILYSITLKLSY